LRASTAGSAEPFEACPAHPLLREAASLIHRSGNPYLIRGTDNVRCPSPLSLPHGNDLDRDAFCSSERSVLPPPRPTVAAAGLAAAAPLRGGLFAPSFLQHPLHWHDMRLYRCFRLPPLFDSQHRGCVRSCMQLITSNSKTMQNWIQLKLRPRTCGTYEPTYARTYGTYK
jgi:hypothetical protein